MEKDNKLQSFSSQAKNNMENALHINEYKFQKPGKSRNNRN